MKIDFREVYTYINSNQSLKQFFLWYQEHCESLTLPYHNLNHTLKMMSLIIDIYKKSQYSYKEYEFKLTDKDLYHLLLSALFHDYNHSGGKFTDDINVKIAKAGLRDCIDDIISNIDDATLSVYEECCHIIDATQYPYVISEEELNIRQQIIRELDILVCLYDDFITHNVFGLMSEMHLDKTINEFVSEYLQFIFKSLNTLKLKYCHDMIEENQNEFFDNIDNFSKLLI